MRTFNTLLSVCLLSIFAICTYDLSAHMPGPAFYGGDSTCMDTFFLKYKGATSFDFKVYPACDTIQWRYAQVDQDGADEVADSLWIEGSAVDTCCFTIDGLDPSTTYLVQLRGWCPETGMYSEWSEAIFDSTRCVGPADETLSHSSLTSSSVTLNTTEGSDGYEWSLRRTSSWSIRHIETSEGHINWIHLPSNMEYEWKVRIKCADGTWSDYSSPQLFSTGEHTNNDCDTLKDSHVSYNNLTSSSANLHCHMYGKKYSWGMRKYGTSNWQTYSTTSGFYQWKNLDPGTKYEYKVKVECEDGYWTDWSTVKYFTTKDDYSCHTPSSHHLSVSGITYNSAHLHCSLDGYEYHWVVRKWGSYSWKDLNTTKANYHWKNLSPGTKYQYKVKMKCHNGSWTGWSHSYHFTTKNHYSNCYTPKSQHMYHKNVDYNSGSTYCDVKGVEYHWKLKKHGSSHWQDKTTTHSYHNWNNLHSGTKYYYKVKVKCNSYDWTGWSGEYHFTTKDHYGSHCSTPQTHHLSVKDLTYHSAKTHCSVEAYEYHWALRPYGSWDWIHKTTSAGHYEWHNLHYNTKYEYKVKVKCHNGQWTNWSYVHSFMTHDHYGSMCSTPQSHHLSVKDLTYNSASTHCGVHGQEYHWAMKPYGSSSWQHYTSKSGTYNWTNLSHGKKYSYKVKVKCNSYDWTGWSNTYHFTTKEHYGSSCSTPQSHHLSVTNLAYNKATTNCAVSGYEYHWAYKLKGTYSWTHKTSSHGYYNWNNLQPNSQYVYKVKVKCHNGNWTGWSYSQSFTTHDHYGSTCSTPGNHHMSVNNISYNSATTHCQVSGAEYHWAIKKYGGDWSHHTSTSGHYDWHDLHSNTHYSYKVKVKCSNGYWTGWSNVHYFTTHKSSYGGYCSTPSGSQYSAHQEAYNLYRIYCHAPFWKWTCAVKPAGASEWSQHSTTVNNMGWGNLLPSTKYEYKVQTTCQGGSKSNWSSVKYFWTSGSSGRPSSTSPTIIDLPGAEAVKVRDHQVSDVSIYPSPANEYFAIQGVTPGSEVTVLDMQGKILMKNIVTSEVDQINVSILENGMYNVLIRSAEGAVQTEKLVVVR